MTPESARSDRGAGLRALFASDRPSPAGPRAGATVDADRPRDGGFDDLVEASLADGRTEPHRARRSRTSPADPTHLDDTAGASPMLSRRPEPSEGRRSEPAAPETAEGDEPATSPDPVSAAPAAARSGPGGSSPGSAPGKGTADSAGSKAAPAGEAPPTEVDASQTGEVSPDGAAAEDIGPVVESAQSRMSHETTPSSRPGAKPGRATAGPTGSSASHGPLEAALSRLGQEATASGDAPVKPSMPPLTQLAGGAVADAMALSSVQGASVENTHGASAELAELAGDQELVGDEPNGGGRSDARSDAGGARAAQRTEPSAEGRDGPSRPTSTPVPPAVSALPGVRSEGLGSSPAPEPASSQAPAPGTADRLVQSMRLQVARGGGDAVVQIRPEHLGAVTISLRVEAGVVTAVVRAEQPAVAEWLQANQHLLKDGLLASGLHLQRLVVTRDGESPSSPRDQSTDPRRRGLRRRPTQPESTFEITM